MENYDKKEFLMKEVDIIQSIINRMTSNSFLIKGWTITLVSAILLLDNIASFKLQIAIVFIPIALFWFLDSYFLWQERLFRKLYDWVISNRLINDEWLLNMNTDRFKEEIPKYAAPLSKTLLLFYGSIVASVLLYLIFIYMSK